VTDEEQQQDGQEHCGIFTIPGSQGIQGAWRDITFVPVRDNIWSVSEGIYRTIFVEGNKGVVAFDTLGTPGGARAYAGAIARASISITQAMQPTWRLTPILSPMIFAIRSFWDGSPTVSLQPPKYGLANASTTK
jgi:hypothetical protein